MYNKLFSKGKRKNHEESIIFEFSVDPDNKKNNIFNKKRKSKRKDYIFFNKEVKSKTIND